MATLREAIQQAKQEPASERAQRLKQAILSGKMDGVAQKEGLDLSPFKAKGAASAPAASPMSPMAKIEEAKGALQQKKGEVGMQAIGTLTEGKSFVQPFKAPSLGISQNLISPENKQFAEAMGPVVETLGKEGELKAAENLIKYGTETPNPLQMGGEIAGAAIKNVPDVVGGLIDVLYGGSGISVLNPLDTRTLEEKSRLGIEGLNRTIKGVFGIAASPLEPLPDTVKEVVGAPFTIVDKGVTEMLKARGIDPESPQGKDIRDSAGNAFGLGTMLYGGVKSGKISLENMSVKEAIDTFKGAPKMATEIPGMVKEGIATKLAPSPEQAQMNINKAIDAGIDKGVKPSVKGKGTPQLMERFKEQSRDAVKTVVENKDRIRLTTPEGEIVTGELPKNLAQFNEAIPQAKTQIFKQFDELQQRTGEQGAKIKLQPVADELALVTESKVLQDTHPEVINYAKTKSDIYAKRGEYTPSQAQEAIKAYNDSLQSFYKNPSYDNFAKVNIDALIANKLRASLNETINNITGENYQALKNRYGALTALEKEVAHRTIVDARKNNIGLGQNFADILSAGEAVHGILSMNPASMVSAVAIKGFAKYIKYLNDPNTAIAKMFKAIDKNTQTLPSSLNPTQSATPTTSPKTGEPVVKPMKAASPKISKSVTISKSTIPEIKKKSSPPTGFKGKATSERAVLNSLNPTGNVFKDYTPQARATAPFGKNMTTLDKTSGKPANEMITVYRGVSGKQKTIVPGDFITTNKQLARDYAGNGKVLELKVRRGDVLDDLSEPMGEEYIYRPSSSKKKSSSSKSAADSLIAEAKKYKTAEKFVESKITRNKSLNHDEFLTEIKVDDVKQESLGGIIPSKGKEITEPIEAEFNIWDNSWRVGDGQHRIQQAIANGDKNIPAKVSYVDRRFNKNESGTYTSIINEKNVTKSQLIEIWNKAHKTTPETSLISEAKKYKSAEEFVEAQTFYRGEGAGKGGNYFTRDKEFANEFAGIKPLTETTVSESSIYRPKTLPEAVNAQQVTKAITEAKKAGFKATYVSEGSPFGEPIESIFVFDKTAIKTKSQLTDIWQRANKKVK